MASFGAEWVDSTCLGFRVKGKGNSSSSRSGAVWSGSPWGHQPQRHRKPSPAWRDARQGSPHCVQALRSYNLHKNTWLFRQFWQARTKLGPGPSSLSRLLKRLLLHALPAQEVAVATSQDVRREECAPLHPWEHHVEEVQHWSGHCSNRHTSQHVRSTKRLLFLQHFQDMNELANIHGCGHVGFTVQEIADLHACFCVYIHRMYTYHVYMCCICIHIYIYIHTHTRMHACGHVCMHGCMPVCMYACRPVGKYDCMHVCMHACPHLCLHDHVSVHACLLVLLIVFACLFVCVLAVSLHVCMYLCKTVSTYYIVTYMHTQIRVHAYMHAYLHASIHAYTLAHACA